MSLKAHSHTQYTYLIFNVFILQNKLINNIFVHKVRLKSIRNAVNLDEKTDDRDLANIDITALIDKHNNYRTMQTFKQSRAAPVCKDRQGIRQLYK